jgi:hypothetical protein
MQSFLDVQRRPVVHFDPKNSEHRKHVSEFLKKGTWANCPVAFYAPDNVSIRTYAMTTLVDFYLQNEFPAESKTSRRRVGKNVDGKLLAINSNKKA